jgi:uncharacterized cupin superfamily protein
VTTGKSAMAFLDADAVRTRALTVEISMEPIIAGAPFAYEEVVHDGPDGFLAVWACDAGVYPRNKDRRGSFMYILDGQATITDQDGATHELTADSVIVLPYGWIGQWDIRRTIRKVYLHSTPAPPFRDGVQPSAFRSATDVLGALGVDGTTVFDGPDGTCTIQEREPGIHRMGGDGHGRFVYVMSGEATVTGDDGSTRTLAPGSVLALPLGWTGTWRVDALIRSFDITTTPATGSGGDQEA